MRMLLLSKRPRDYVIATFLSLVFASSPSLGVASELDQAIIRLDKILSRPVSQYFKSPSGEIPALMLLENSRSIAQVCEDNEIQMNVRFCKKINVRYLARDWANKVVKSYGDPGAAYAIAVSHGLLLQANARGGEGQFTSIAELQAICLAGVSLGLSQKNMGLSLDQSIKAARTFYFVDAKTTLPEERAYALLSGVGATKSSCSTTDLSNLRARKISDIEVLESLKPQRLPGLVIDSFCRKPPECPRPIPLNLGI
jgi:hypothetical protein